MILMSGTITTRLIKVCIVVKYFFGTVSTKRDMVCFKIRYGIIVSTTSGNQGNSNKQG